MMVDPSHVQEDMAVFGTDGERVGRVKEVHEHDFLIDRSLARDLSVPFEAIQIVTDDGLILTTRADEVDAADWSRPATPDGPPII